MPRAGLTGCIELNPNKQTIFFGGLAINLSAVSREVGLSPSQVSRILSGKRDVSLVDADRLAQVLEMSIDEFAESLYIRVGVLAIPHERIVQLHMQSV